MCLCRSVLQPSLGFTHLPVTDEDVRTGDPHETIRRASMVPSQLKDSVAAHRLSLAPPAAAAHGRAPQVSKSREVRSTRSPLAPKRPAGQVQDLDTPEVRGIITSSCISVDALNYKLKKKIIIFSLFRRRSLSAASLELLKGGTFALPAHRTSHRLWCVYVLLFVRHLSDPQVHVCTQCFQTLKLTLSLCVCVCVAG